MTASKLGHGTTHALSDLKSLLHAGQNKSFGGRPSLESLESSPLISESFPNSASTAAFINSKFCKMYINYLIGSDKKSPIKGTLNEALDNGQALVSQI